MPFALVIDQAADLPLRQFEIEQRDRGVGPGAGLDQALDARALAGLTDRREASAGLADDVGHELGGDGVSVAQPLAEVGGGVLR